MRRSPWLVVGLLGLAVVMSSCGGGKTPGVAVSTSSVTTSSVSTSSVPASSTTTLPSSSTSTTSHASSTTTTVPNGPTITLRGWTGVEPNVIYFSGDAGNIVSGMTWTSWTASSAQGNGTWEYDDCNPSCAQGTSTPYPTTLKLTAPSGGQFTQLTEIQSGPHGQTSTYTLPSTFIGGPS